MNEKLWACYFARANIRCLEKMIEDTEEQIERLVKEKNAKMGGATFAQKANLVNSSSIVGSLGNTHLCKIQEINSKRVSAAKMKTVVNSIIKKVESSTSENYRDLLSRLEIIERVNFETLAVESINPLSSLSSLPLDIICLIRNFSTGCETKPVRFDSSFLITDALRMHSYCEPSVKTTR